MQTNQQINFQPKEKQISTQKYRYFTEQQRRTKTARPLHQHYFQQYEKYVGEGDTLSIGSSSHETVNQRDVNADKDKYDVQLKLQNEDLKIKLCQLRSIVEELTIQLSIARQEAKQLKRQLKFCQIQRQKKIRYLLQQLEFVLEKNSLLDQQISNLSSDLKFANSSYLNRTQVQLPKDQKYNRSSQNTFHQSIVRDQIQSKDKQKKYEKQCEQLLSSIKQMHISITGSKITNLQELWRWLKQVGQTYSWFKRWRIKVRQFLSRQCLNYDQALILLGEGSHFH